MWLFKVVCIRNIDDLGCLRSLTIGKTYEVLFHSGRGYYTIYDDNNSEVYNTYHESFFQRYNERLDDQIEKVLE